MTKLVTCPYCKENTKPVHLSTHIRDTHGKDVWYQWVDKVLEKIAESENFDNMVDVKSQDNSKN